MNGDPRDRAVPMAGVIGAPISHSLSPAMMTKWLEAQGAPGLYAAIHAAPHDFKARVRALRDQGFSGLNVTLPHKEAALALADAVDPPAQAIGAANVLYFGSNGSIFADNTDVNGFWEGLGATAYPANTENAPVVVFGAGGAARSAVHALAAEAYETIRLVNRDTARAEALARDLAPGAEIFALADQDAAMEGAGIVINATSLGMVGQPPLEPDFRRTRPDAVAFDMVYRPLETPFLKAARAAGLEAADGLTMLIGQAEPCYRFFFNPDPTAFRTPLDDVVDMRAYLLGLLGERA